MKKLEHTFESIFFSGRWLLVPFFIGLIVAMAALLYKFLEELTHLFTHLSLQANDLILLVLAMVDLTLLANLLIIITFSGYESFVSKIDVIAEEDRPSWMGKVGFSTLKVKLISSIVAIAGIDLLRVFINLNDLMVKPDPVAMQSLPQVIEWKLLIYAAFVFSGLLFAIMDYLSARQSSR
ncbi:MAG: TIGR00645 family protein [Arenicella sp.]